MYNFIGLQTFIEREIERCFRVAIQTIVTPWITALLYIFVFGYVVGQRIENFGGFSYIDFVLPGVLMLNLINASFSQTSSSLYFQRFAKHIEEILVAPFSYGEMILGYVAGGIARGMIVGVGIYVIAILFSAANMAHLGLFLLYSLSVSIIFSFLGLLVALWANNFEQLAILNTFLITPLTFLGGVFNSIYMLPERFQFYVRLNPFFYFVDGLRYAMIGVHEANTAVGAAIILGLMVGLGGLVWYLFKIGWRIRV